MSIAFIDSGIGGLTVLNAFCQTSAIKSNPNSSERLIYLADLKNMPYGQRSLAELHQIMIDNLQWLSGEGISEVILACNTSSALLDDEIRREFSSMQIHGLLDYFEAALHKNYSSLKSLVIFATPATVETGQYRRRAQSILGPDAQIISIPCPELVPFIESDLENRERAHELIQGYLSSVESEIQPEQIEGYLFGCSHYPVLANAFQEIMPHADALDPARLLFSELLWQGGRTYTFEPYATARPEHLEAQLISLRPYLNCVELFPNQAKTAAVLSRRAESIETL